MDKNFDLYSKYYNLLYRNKDYAAEAKYVSDCIRHYSKNAHELLEFGSGTGSHGLLLQEMGYSVFGLEKSQNMVDEAKKTGLNCMQADITDFTIKSKYDAVISLFHVISYITENIDLQRVFSNANKSLRSDGLFIFDVWYTPAVYNNKPENRIKRVENEEIIVYRFARPDVKTEKNIVEVCYSIIVKDKKSGELMEFTELHPMRHFSIPEISFLASQTGFEIKKVEEFLTGSNPSPETWGVNFILKKIQ